MGKSYACRSKSYEKAAKDFYPTPKCCTWELLRTNELYGLTTILEPAYGEGAIANELAKKGYKVTVKDLRHGNDFLEEDYKGQKFDAIVTNPPFALFDEFVQKAKTIDCRVIVMLGRMNHFGSHKTNANGIWKNLSDIYVFDRQIAYDRPFREDGKAECGCLVTGWFVWSRNWVGDPRIHLLDMDKYIVRKGE